MREGVGKRRRRRGKRRQGFRPAGVRVRWTHAQGRRFLLSAFARLLTAAGYPSLGAPPEVTAPAPNHLSQGTTVATRLNLQFSKSLILAIENDQAWAWRNIWGANSHRCEHLE
ncbi:Hypothetical predicted protein [Podarcis lilfordi]|uniref:Uncharacterized protein n=1 Tax=Podarcis lilfordi TaxID=74358 RepID=A0AA35KQF2_9SAUR|nr:Hypothetical predicted protein [Podarcis lilfordi]